MSFTRRDFLGATTAGLAAGALATDTAAQTAIPTRMLGQTGARVSILAFGGGSRFLQYTEEEQAIEALHKALALGINYVDTCDDYGKEHLSEKRIGKALQGRRDGVFLVTKVTPRKNSDAARSFEASLNALQTDHVDLLHIHQLMTPQDLAAIEAPDGVLAQVVKFRDQKMTRFIGITCHADPAVLKTALERHDFDCTQMALNAGAVSMMSGTHGMAPDPSITTSFETLALPVALRKKMGILAMKTFGQDALVGQAPIEKMLYYTLSLPVTAAVVGMPKLQHIEDNVRLAKAFQPLPAAEMKQMAAALSHKNKASLDRFFRTHIDA